MPRLSERLNQQRGLNLARAVQAAIRSGGDWIGASNHALTAWPEQLEIHRLLRSAVNAGTLQGSTWGGGLVATQTIVGEFVQAVQASSILGRLQGVHRIPFNSRVPRELASASVGWIGEGAPTPANELSYDSVSLGTARVGGLIAISDELARSSSPQAEQVVRDSLVRAMASFIDRNLLDPSLAASGTHPPSLTNGLTPIVSSGSSASAIGADVVSLIDALISGGNTEMANLFLAMSPRVAARIAAKREAAGAAPTLTLDGGTLSGIPVIVSASSNWSVSGGGQITLIDANELLLADDGLVEIDVSREAAVQLNTAPSAGANQLASLFQLNLHAVKATRSINWTTRHGAAAAAAYLDGSQY